MDQKEFELTKKLQHAEADLNVLLVAFGDELAAKEGYKTHKGIDAIHWYLVNHFKWLPSQVKSLNFEDLRFLMTEQMAGWTLPKQLRD